MNYQEFTDAVLDGIQEFMGNNKQVTLKKVLKNNSVYLDGLTIMEDKQNMTPTIYLNPYYQEYVKGIGIGEIVYKILKIYESRQLSSHIDVDFYTNFHNVTEKIVYKLINYEKNKELLLEIPHIKYLDLAIVFYCLVHHDIFGNASILIYNNHLNMWDITEEKLLTVARKNTPRLLKYDLRSLDDVLLEILKDNINKADSNSKDYGILETDDKDILAMQMLDSIKKNESLVPMYVLSNKEKMNGAACILYQGILSSFAEEMKQDLYILPSSIHEVIIIPAAFGKNPIKLEEMVREVNRTQLEAEEVLSDRIYLYSREKACIC